MLDIKIKESGIRVASAHTHPSKGIPLYLKSLGEVEHLLNAKKQPDRLVVGVDGVGVGAGGLGGVMSTSMATGGWGSVAPPVKTGWGRGHA